jgi:hypothetical protein
VQQRVARKHRRGMECRKIGENVALKVSDLQANDFYPEIQL